MEDFSCLRFGYFFKLSNNDFDGQLQEALGADCVMESIALNSAHIAGTVSGKAGYKGAFGSSPIWPCC
jgi:hypothetical protein